MKILRYILSNKVIVVFLILLNIVIASIQFDNNNMLGVILSLFCTACFILSYVLEIRHNNEKDKKEND